MNQLGTSIEEQHALVSERVPMFLDGIGRSGGDQVAEDGQVHDADRTTLLVDHLAAVLDAVDERVPGRLDPAPVVKDSGRT